jgi:putative ABC transport system substrate-binding protein
VRAQQPGRSATIGLLASSTATAERLRRLAFVTRLAELGWVEGRNLTIEDRAAEGIVARAGEIGAEFARLKVDVMVMAGDAQILAAKRAAPDISDRQRSGREPCAARRQRHRLLGAVA